MSETSPAFVPNLISVDSWIPSFEGWTTEKDCATAGAGGRETLAVEWWCSLGWLSEKHWLLLIATNEGSFSGALISDLLAGEGVIAVADVAVVVVVAGGLALSVGVCALVLLWSRSCSVDAASSLASCWYISSTMGFHKRTLALMNQFETWKTKH